MTGSVTSIGIAYERNIDLDTFAVEILRGLVALPGETLDRRWPMRFLYGDHEAWVATELCASEDFQNQLKMLKRFLTSPYGELDISVYLRGIGRVTGIIRPEYSYTGILIDFFDADLYFGEGMRDPGIVEAAVKDVLTAWYDASRFSVAFADHEAEFEYDPLSLKNNSNEYALLVSTMKGSSDSLDFPPLCHALTPLGG